MAQHICGHSRSPDDARPGGRVDRTVHLMSGDDVRPAHPLQARIPLVEHVEVVQVGAQSLHLSHEYAGYTLDLVVYRASTADHPQRLRVHDFRWVRAEEFDQYEFPTADQRTIDALLDG